jgi:hypothetical protein
MGMPLVNNLGGGSYSPCGEKPRPTQKFILNMLIPFLLREGQANHAQTQRQAKWSRFGKILWAKSIDEKSNLILPLYYGKKTLVAIRLR